MRSRSWLSGLSYTVLFAVLLVQSAALFAQATESMEIRLQQAHFDPVQQQAQIPAELRTNAPLRSGNDYYLVQFNGPIQKDWRRNLEAMGADVIDYVPDFAYIVRMDEGVRADLSNLSYVRWTGIYQPAYRLDVVLNETALRPASGQSIELVVRGFAGESSNDIRSQLSALGASFVSEGEGSDRAGLFRVTLPESALIDLTHVAGVAWIEPYSEPRLFNEIARSAEAMNQDGVESVLGLYGQNQVVAVGDTGLSTGDVNTVHQDFEGRVIGGTTGPASTCGGWADNFSHGTHVAGSVLGSGFHSGADIPNQDYTGSNAGIAPEAEAFIWGFCNDFSGLPDDGYNDYYSVIYDEDPRARVNTNSWGFNTTPGSYNTFTRETDRFVWDHPDMVLTYAASNDGVDADSDGVIDLGSIGVPASAKNIITVGASENFRMDGGYNPGGPCSTWGGCWPSDFPADPINSDRLSDDTGGMVAFSSRGPTNSGRLKPDVVAPGSNIVSARNESTGTGWGVYDEHYIYNGGTSMATPLVAGASAVVRDYFETEHGFSPDANLVKAILINGAFDMTPGQYGEGATQNVTARPDNHQGWGRVDLVNSLVYDDTRGLEYVDHTGLDTGEDFETTFYAGADAPLRVTLVWTDYPGTEASDGALTNDLDLIVETPDGTLLGNHMLTGGTVDRTNNVEGVDIELPESGGYTLRVEGFNVPEGPQPFVLVMTGNFGGFGLDPASAEACTTDGNLDYEITLTEQFEGTTNLTASGLPSGTNGSFDPDPVIAPDNTSTFTLADLDQATGGDYELEFTATDDSDSSITATVLSDLTLYEASTGPIVLQTPADEATNIELQPGFAWDAASAADYQIQVATDSGFTDIVIDETVAGSSFEPAAELATGADYFWRVRGNNACGTGDWSDVFEFQTRFEPIIDVTPEAFTIEVEPDAVETDTLEISNTGTGSLDWTVEIDELVRSGAGTLEVDPALDETFSLGDFTLIGDATAPPEVEFTVEAGDATTGDVVGFSFVGTADPGGSWASDSCMIIEAPDGTTYGVGGFSSYEPNCGPDFQDAPWDFQGPGSTDPGTYESDHSDAFAGDPLIDEGTWTITFLNAWTSAGAADIEWSDVEVTLHKQPLPVCIEGEMTSIPWLSVNPDAGSTAAAGTDNVTVEVDANGLTHGEYEGYLCVGSNSTDGNTMVAIPVIADVFDPNIGVLEGTVTTTGYCQADPGPVEGATVEAVGALNTYTTTTDSDGYYVLNIPIDENPVDVTVTAPDHLEATTNLSVVGGEEVVEDFDLPVDSACATVTPEAFDFELVLGNTDSDTLTIGNVDGNVDLDWAVEEYTLANEGSTRAIVALEEDFEGTFPPADWTVTDDGADSCPWLTTEDYPMPDWGGSERGAGVDSDECFGDTFGGSADTSLITPELDLSGATNLQLTFDLAIRDFSGTEVFVDASTDGGDTWDTLESWAGNFAYPADASLPVEIDLTDYEGESSVQLRWRYTSGWDYWAYVDNIYVGEVPPSCENPNNVPWMTLGAGTGTTAPGATDDISVGIDTAGLEDGDYEASICVGTNDGTFGDVEVPVSLTVHDPELGSLTGQVYSQTCSADPVALGNAELTIEGSQGGTFTTQADANGNYFIKVHEDESPVSITATASGHEDQTVSGISYEGLDVVTTDITLPESTPCADVAPDSISFSLDADDTAAGVVDLSNVGHAQLDWTIDTADGLPAGVQRPDPASAVAGDKKPAQSDGVVISSGRVEIMSDELPALVDERGTGPTLSVDGKTTGDVYDSGDPDNSTVNLDIGAGNALIGIGWEVTVEAFDPSLLSESVMAFVPTAGDDTGLFLTVGVDDEAPGVGTYSSGGVLMLEDNGIDPVPANANGNLHIEWHDAFADFPDDIESVWSDPESGDALPPGLRLVCDDQAACDAAVEAANGGGSGPSVCDDPEGISWLDANPAFGVTQAGQTTAINVDLDTAGMQPGDYEASLCVTSNDPIESLIAVPVSLEVRVPTAWSGVEGTVTSPGYCGDDFGPIEGATIEIIGSSDTYTVNADASGYYEVAMPASEGPVDVNVTHPGYQAGSAQGVNLTQGSPVPVDFDLEYDAPCAVATPDAMSEALEPGGTSTQTLELSNNGASDLDWSTAEEPIANVVGGVSGNAGAGVATSANEGGMDMASQFGGTLPTIEGLALGTAIDCENAADLVIHDDGSIENGYSGNAASVSEVAIVEYYEPENYPATIDNVCLSFITLATSDQDLSYELVIFADDGTNGAPGTEIGAVSATAEGIPGGGLPAQVPWFTADLSSLDLAIQSGGVYIGVRYVPTTEGIFIAADETAGTTQQQGWFQTDGGAWQVINDAALFPDYRAMLVRPQMPLAGCMSPGDVSWLDVSPNDGVTAPGDSANIEVSVDATGLSNGVYEAFVCIFSNDPENPELGIPYTLEVSSGLIFSDRFEEQ